MHKALRDDLGVKPSKMLHRQELTANHEGPKMQGNPQGDGRRQAAEPRVHGREEILHPAVGKPAK